MTRAGAVTSLFLVVVFPLALLGCPPKAYPQCGQDSGAQCANPPEAVTGEDLLPFGPPMTAPEKISGPAPEYTQEALERGVEGTMLVTCVITREGEARQCRIIQPVPHMEGAVLSSLAQSRFKPATLDGKPVSVTYTMSFKLKAPTPPKTP